MSRKSTTPTLTGSALRNALRALALAVAALFVTASAQGLTNLLPQETFVALGLNDLEGHEAKFQPFIDEWNRLDLGTLLQDTAPEEQAGELEELEEQFPEALADLDFYDGFGGEVWVALSASSSNPLPAFTLVAQVSDDAAAGLAATLEEQLSEGDFQTFSEGNITFYVGSTSEFEDPIAFAQEGDLVAASSNPDVLRGVLRRYQGATEPNFTDSAGYAATVAPLLPGNVTFYFDLPRIVDLVTPFAAGMGFDASVDRLSRALKTFGTFGTVTRLTDAGMESVSLQALGDPSLDPTLHALLTGGQPASDAPLAFVPAGSIGYSSSYVDLGAWWSYLDELVADLPELGIGSLDSFLLENVGIDLNQMLFGWMGDNFAAITPFMTATAEIGVAPENLLGDGIYLIETTDPAAADQGLTMLLQMAGAMASSFADPEGEGMGGMVAPTTRTVAGTDVDSYEFTDGMVFEIAITDGYVLIATSSAAMDAALEAGGSGQLPSTLAPLAAEVPADATSVSLADGAASLEALGNELTTQFGLFSGLAGGSDLDFEAAEAAATALGDYFDFLAARAGGSYGYNVVDGNVLRGYSFWNVSW